MSTHRMRALLFAVVVACAGSYGMRAASSPIGPPTGGAATADQKTKAPKKKLTLEERKAAAARFKKIRDAAIAAGALIAPAPAQGGVPDYFGPYSNWANSPVPTVDPVTGAITGGIRKFVDALPGLTAAAANDLGQYIPVAVPDTTTYPGSDYYEIELGDYAEKMHQDLNPTKLRGYRQTNTNDATVSQFHYLGPLIVARRDRPLRIRFTNRLATGDGGRLFLPLDTTVMGAGMGPLGMNVTAGNQMNYTENRATIHLHGGLLPWISDGTQHQWIVPAGENTDYKKGASVAYVPDMWFDANGATITACAGMTACLVPGATNNPGDGSMTFYYPNQQSARLMFYHDHAYGITRLNVYAGEAAGYLLTDDIETALVNAGIIPSDQIPLIVQDKTFVDPTMIPDPLDPLTMRPRILTTDPTWPFPLDATKSNLWLPHVYMVNQNPWSQDGTNPMGRWDYGPWFWPPWPISATEPANPYYDPINAPWEPPTLPAVPTLSTFMEAFMDTPLVNGTAYPVLTVDPKAYRFRILNASNDRFWNLQLYVADPDHPTEVRMVPSNGTVPFPSSWPKPDLRDGGVPDPSLIGPSMIQIGNEGGFLPAPVVWPNIPIGWDRNPKSMTVGNVLEHNLFLGPAERADVIVDFSQFAGKTLILYNDGPTAVPALDPRFDYYTGNPDLTDVGGAPSTLPGYGPNTRTVMQIKVNATGVASFNFDALQSAFAHHVDSNGIPAGVFESSQDPIIVPQAGYNSAYGQSFPADRTAYARIQDTSLTFTPMGAAGPVKIDFNPKAIAEEFESTYGRMSAFLGIEMPFTNGGNQTTIFYTVKDPVTEVLKDTDLATPIGSLGDGTQIWKITHNGVDTHPIHFHLFNVQLINRVDWAGVVKPPEPNELGWKETVRMNPLEDAIVALRPAEPTVPFALPNSIRPLDPTMPLGDATGFTGVDQNGNPVTITNALANFGYEYVWHCHILGHEEMDMMRPMAVAGRPASPSNLLGTLALNPRRIVLTWIDSSVNETAFVVQRFNGSGVWADLATIASVTGPSTGSTLSYTDATVAPNGSYQYRILARNVVGYLNADPAASYPTATADSSPSNIITAGPPAAPSNVIATQPGTRKGDPVVITWTDNAPNASNANLEDGFTVRRSTSLTGPWTTLTTTVPPSAGSGGTVRYTDSTIGNRKTYYYQVAATNKMGESSPAVSNAITTR